MKLKAKDRLIVALDYKTLDEVKDIVNEIGDAVSTYKVGLELFLNTRGEAVDYLHSIDKKVFLDLKFHDIPNTTTMASMFANKQEVFMFNVHAGGGPTMMRSVADMLKENSSDSIAIAVTVLTSFTEEEAAAHFKSDLNISGLANHWAIETKESGLHGVVCSPLEAKKIKELCGENFYTICPGVRPLWAASNDQKRIMTPKIAVENGADFLVVGRPITKSENPVHAAKLILEEIEAGLKIINS
ncbi:MULTISPECIES: orotidine-5'-phosphate decarboxylase [Psychrilyobacter]|uniref:Orotidine 5'-phosphate decarboxylase n=1 Tax=Psychrilyobacter piezotolerans TaxID=2293438 RepID=A0ABX9KJC0_9FUSO|nr:MULTISPECIES: orotidine-5'-phosphate decarboxylase [Psychrilyobacter]MCS5420229.1 orotidine-5'-phosphate decarboxylase [Psychrilyobacter sp. S5]NDI77254.1 orotidine-5'-phosphate decarboxylase [Psychrilyobacter piezotolerans]RDE63312.1 orotidine-5'-phosphate decarboxylase [Psychrilyobacter sp. S5]REI41854.1 orotidine-5'-phosphate decarboxylase [Psychrilyobacter piezotolerans]